MKERIFLNIGKIEGAADMLDLQSDSQAKNLSLFLRRISTELLIDILPAAEENKTTAPAVTKSDAPEITVLPKIVDASVQATPLIHPVDAESERPCMRANCPDKGKLFRVRFMTKSKFGLFCTKFCYKREYARLYVSKSAAGDTEGKDTNPEPVIVTHYGNGNYKPDVLNIEFDICANPGCPKKFGKFVKGTGMTKRDLLFCNENCADDYLKNPANTGYLQKYD